MSPLRNPFFAILALACACDPPPKTAATAARAAATDAGPHAPVFADRTKQVPFDRARARLEAIRSALLSPSLASAKTTELGYECASLRADQTALATEADPIVSRLIADVDRMCGLDVPLAASYVELHDLELKRLTNGSVKAECFGLKVALADFGRPYVTNPQVVEVRGKFKAWCNDTSD